MLRWQATCTRRYGKARQESGCAASRWIRRPETRRLRYNVIMQWYCTTRFDLIMISSGTDNHYIMTLYLSRMASCSTTAFWYCILTFRFQAEGFTDMRRIQVLVEPYRTSGYMSLAILTFYVKTLTQTIRVVANSFKHYTVVKIRTVWYICDWDTMS